MFIHLYKSTCLEPVWSSLPFWMPQRESSFSLSYKSLVISAIPAYIFCITILWISVILVLLHFVPSSFFSHSDGKWFSHIFNKVEKKSKVHSFHKATVTNWSIIQVQFSLPYHSSHQCLDGNLWVYITLLSFSERWYMAHLSKHFFYYELTVYFFYARPDCGAAFYWGKDILYAISIPLTVPKR